MTPEADRLLDLATRGLAANQELHLAARSMLASRIESSGAQAPQVEAASLAFAAADGSPLRRHRRMLLLTIALLSVLFAIAQGIQQWNDLAWAREIYGVFSPSNPVQAVSAPGLSSTQKLLLHGRIGATSETERWKPLWENQPENPAFLAQYAAACFADHGKLPAEVLEAAERIDPDNGWYQALDAAAMLDGALTRESQSMADRKAFKTPVILIKDPARLEQGLALIRQAAAKPRFVSYGKELIAMRIPLLAERTDISSTISIVAYTAGITTQAHHFRRFADAFAASAARYAAVGDAQAFLKITADHEAISRKVINDSWTLVETLISKNLLVGPSRNLRDAARTLGLQEALARYETLAAWEREDRTRREARGARPAASELIDAKGSIMTSQTLPMITKMVKSPPPLADTDLQPIRRAEHALILRFLCYAAILLIALAAGVAACQRYFTSTLIHSLSNRMTQLFSPRDEFLLLGAGPLIPLGAYAAVIHLSPLSSREWALHGPAGFLILAQAGALVILMLAFPMALAGSILDRRGKVFQLGATSPLVRWLVLGCGFLGIPALGALGPALHEMKLPNAPLFALLAVAATLALIPLFWLLAGFLQPILGTRENTLRLATLTRIAAPVWAAGVIVLPACAHLLHQDERLNTSRDRLLRISAEAPAMSSYEWEITQRLRGELLDLFR